MNEIVNNFLSAGDKFTPEMHFRQLGFTYCTCGPFTKNKERIQKFKEQEIHDNFYHNELDKPCFKHNMAYGDFKELTKEQFVLEYWVIQYLILLKSSKYDGYQQGYASMVYTLFDEKTSAGAIKNMSNKEVAEESHKPIIRKFNNRKVHSFFMHI